MVTAPRRFDLCLVAPDPTLGSEIKKARPCVVVSPDEMNRYVRTAIVAPMTTASRPYPTSASVTFQGQEGQIAPDQIRTVDKARLIRRLGRLPEATARRVTATLVEMFTDP